MVPQVCDAHASHGVALTCASWQRDPVGQLAAKAGWSAGNPQTPLLLLSAHRETDARSHLPASNQMQSLSGRAGLPQMSYAGGTV